MGRTGQSPEQIAAEKRRQANLQAAQYLGRTAKSEEELNGWVAAYERDGEWRFEGSREAERFAQLDENERRGRTAVAQARTNQQAGYSRRGEYQAFGADEELPEQYQVIATLDDGTRIAANGGTGRGLLGRVPGGDLLRRITPDVAWTALDTRTGGYGSAILGGREAAEASNSGLARLPGINRSTAAQINAYGRMGTRAGATAVAGIAGTPLAGAAVAGSFEAADQYTNQQIGTGEGMDWGRVGLAAGEAWALSTVGGRTDLSWATRAGAAGALSAGFSRARGNDWRTALTQGGIAAGSSAAASAVGRATGNMPGWMAGTAGATSYLGARLTGANNREAMQNAALAAGMAYAQGMATGGGRQEVTPEETVAYYEEQRRLGTDTGVRAGRETTLSRERLTDQGVQRQVTTAESGMSGPAIHADRMLAVDYVGEAAPVGTAAKSAAATVRAGGGSAAGAPAATGGMGAAGAPAAGVPTVGAAVPDEYSYDSAQQIGTRDVIPADYDYGAAAQRAAPASSAGTRVRGAAETPAVRTPNEVQQRHWYSGLLGRAATPASAAPPTLDVPAAYRAEGRQPLAYAVRQSDGRVTYTNTPPLERARVGSTVYQLTYDENRTPVYTAGSTTQAPDRGGILRSPTFWAAAAPAALTIGYQEYSSRDEDRRIAALEREHDADQEALQQRYEAALRGGGGGGSDTSAAVVIPNIW